MSEPATFTEEDRARIEWQIHKLRFDSTQPGIPEIQEQWLKDAEVLTRALAYIEQLESALAADGPAPTTLKGEDDDEAG